MKRSFYQMLGVEPNADQARIDAAYASAMAKLDATTNLRGVAESVTEMNLIREGYQILSDPARRARYDAKLAADEAGVKLMFFPEDSVARRKLGVQTIILLIVTAVFAGVLYRQLSIKMDEVQTEHKQALAKQRGVQSAPPAKAAVPQTETAKAEK